MAADTTKLTARHENLSGYRYYTGAQPVPLHPDEECPPLFRDVGFEAMAAFMRGSLKRLCGPVSPVTFLRTADYREPYLDHGRIGRIMLLRPDEICLWHSGVESIYISPRETPVSVPSMVFIPSEVSLAEAAVRFRSAKSICELQELYGVRRYREAAAETLHRLDHLQRTHKESERIAAPLRRLFQSMEQRNRDQARTLMHRGGLNESDLCTAWHHLSDDRRAEILPRLLELQKDLCP